MNNVDIVHSLNGYLHNVTNLLKCLKEDAVIKDEDTKEMLEIALEREKEILNIMKLLEKKDMQ